MENNESKEDRKVYYTYRMFKKLTEERRWFTKLFVLLSKEEWESCGKGILKFYQVDKDRLIDIKKKEDIDKKIDNLYLIIDTIEVKDNPEQDLWTAQKHQNILKTREFDQNEVICFYNLRYGHNFSKDREKVIRWCHLYPDNENQQIALSFNDEVALFHAWKIFCEFKKIPSQHPIPVPSSETIDSIIEDLTQQKYLAENGKSKEMYIHFYSEDEFFTKKLFEFAEKANNEENIYLLTKIAKVIKLLISFSSKPDIILQFVNDKNYKNFFNCLKYIENRNKKEFEPLLKRFLETDINNIFNIKDSHILETIKINYRIIFLKEIILPDLFTQEQSNDITNYLLLHGNNIIVYIIDNMENCFNDINKEIQENTKKVGDFFHELSYILRLFSFPVIKDEFSNTFVNFGYHFLIADLLITKMIKKIEEKDKDIIIVCLEILKMICKDNCILLVDIFLYENNDEIGILDKIINLIDLNDKNIFDLVVNLFRTLNLSIQKDLNEKYVSFVVEALIPKIQKQIKNLFSSEHFKDKEDFQHPKPLKKKEFIIKENNPQSNIHLNLNSLSNNSKLFIEKISQKPISKKLIKFVFFGLEIFNQLFLFKVEKIQNSLYNSNIIDCLNKIVDEKSSKLLKIYFCTYLKKLIDLKIKNVKNFQHVKSFKIFWEIFQLNMNKKRYNLLKSLTLSLLTSISNSENSDFIRNISFFAQKSKLKEIPILRQILNKAKIRGLLEIDSKITSESECSLRPKSEKSKNKNRLNLMGSIMFEDDKIKIDKKIFNNIEKIECLNGKIQKLKQKDKKDKDKSSVFEDDPLLVKRDKLD